jgi:hypothetical protein
MDNYKSFDNLTSTVKKIKPGKLDKMKMKIDSNICEHSIIPNVSETPLKKTNVSDESYGVRLTYFLRDLNQVNN